MKNDLSKKQNIPASLQQKISQAKARLLVEQPYFGTLASRLELRQSDELGTFISDGTELAYNDDYLDTLNIDELGFVLSNGAMHAVLAHDTRQKGRMSWLWQLATDHAINAMLVDNGLSVPPMINYEQRFDGLYAEEIYATLKDEIKNEEFNDDEENETGYNEDNKKQQEQMSQPDQDEAKEKNRPKMEVENEYRAQESETLEEQFKQMQEQSMQKFLDELPHGIERFVEITKSAVIDWRSELSHALDKHYRSDYRTLPPSKRLLYMGTYLPSLHSERLQLVIAIDSSGSVDEALLGDFITEIESLMLHFHDYEIELLVCDAKIHSSQTFLSGDKLEYELKGGGATDFRPVFERVEEELPFTQLLLYFTDMQGTFPKMEPLYEVLWISPSSTEAPFGRVISMQ